MLKKVLAVFPVFIFFAFSGLFVFVSPSSPVVFLSGDSDSEEDKEERRKINQLWSEIKSELKTKYAYLSKTSITIDGKEYDLKPLFAAAKDDVQYEKEGSELSVQAKDKLQELVNAIITTQKLKDALENTAMDLLWSEIKSDLKKPNYAYLSKTFIWIDGIYDLEPLFAAAKDDTQYEKKGSELLFRAQRRLKDLVNANIDAQKLKDALTAADTKNNENLNTFWSNIKDKLKKLEYTYSAKNPILVNDKDYKLEVLFTAAKNDAQYEKKGSELPAPAKNKLQELVNANIDGEKVKVTLANTAIDLLWSETKSELKTYAHLSTINIEIDGTRYDLTHVFAAAKDDIQYEKKLSELSFLGPYDQLQKLVNANITAQKLKVALTAVGAKNNEELDALWSNIKDELKKPEYTYLAKTTITVDWIDHNLEVLFTAAKDDTQYRKEGSQLPDPAKDKLQELVSEFVNAQKFKDALDVKNNENLNTIWSGIKDELKKLEYTYLVKTPITVDGTDYNLEVLFTAAKDDTQYRKEGSELSEPGKNKLQSLVSADVQHQIFKTSLTKANIQNNQKLDDLWTQLKKVLNQPEFSKWKNTSIEIKSKNYNLQLLFTNTKEKADVKGSAFSLDAKLQLQELVNDQVTSKMIENQLLALNRAEAEKNKQTPAAKNKQAKEKQQSQGLNIGLATGGGVLFVASVGGFLYWFFKIRK